MTDQMLMPPRADGSPNSLHRIGRAASRAGDAGEIRTVAMVAPRHHRFASRRPLDCRSRYGSAIVSWSDVASAWLLMVAVTAALLGG
jgi:hypothetical protein